tara:strand:- start:117 stop:545 length:429 start_codon:yes stop_codon:yes gene_type:complete
MRTHLKLLLLTGVLFAQYHSPYISPGVQLGINSKGKMFTSAQITIGIVGTTPPIGFTIGKRWYHLNQEKKSYSYYDLQVWPVLFGIGIGQIIDDKGNKSIRFKTGAGLWGYLTFDYSSFENLKYNFGAIGVLPILVEGLPPL